MLNQNQCVHNTVLKIPFFEWSIHFQVEKNNKSGKVNNCLHLEERIFDNNIFLKKDELRLRETLFALFQTVHLFFFSFDEMQMFFVHICTYTFVFKYKMSNCTVFALSIYSFMIICDEGFDEDIYALDGKWLSFNFGSFADVFLSQLAFIPGGSWRKTCWTNSS